jgi:hypothetical protein
MIEIGIDSFAATIPDLATGKTLPPRARLGFSSDAVLEKRPGRSEAAGSGPAK